MKNSINYVLAATFLVNLSAGFAIYFLHKQLQEAKETMAELCSQPVASSSPEDALVLQITTLSGGGDGGGGIDKAQKMYQAFQDRYVAFYLVAECDQEPATPHAKVDQYELRWACGADHYTLSGGPLVGHARQPHQSDK